MYITLIVILILIFSLILILNQPQFGAKARGKRLQRMMASTNYKGRVFMNHSFTPTITEGFSMTKVLIDFLFLKGKGTRPPASIPAIKNDLKNLPEGNWLVWFGHSSYFMTIDGITILVDPVFSGNASPIAGSTKAFPGTDMYTAEDMPAIDYLVITHDHYDHLDYRTVRKLKSNVGKVICGLGVGAHLERWGYEDEVIIELDWNTDVTPQEGITFYALPARHFSGRTFRRNTTLWISVLLKTPSRKIYIGGDSGYDKHFVEIGERHGPIDLAILENGQYNEAWKAIHFLPGENLQAALDLKANRVMPVHSSKFDLALHNWDEPLKEMVRLNQHIGLDLVTPMIGELVDLDDHERQYHHWWEEVGTMQQ
jgi:L-ascorbate metabolism protein UlaG (beta-lactamase superfamily)